MQVYEFSLNVSKGTVDATDIFAKFRSDVVAVKVQARSPFAAITRIWHWPSSAVIGYS